MSYANIVVVISEESRNMRPGELLASQFMWVHRGNGRPHGDGTPPIRMTPLATRRQEKGEAEGRTSQRSGDRQRSAE